MIKRIKYISNLKSIRLYVNFLFSLVVIALLAQFLANDKPLVCKYKNNWLFPAFSFDTKKTININGEQEILNYNMGKEWKKLNADLIIFPICAYSPNSIDAINAPLYSPFKKQLFETNTKQIVALPIKYRHWLGTTQNGTDVLSNIIHGTSVAISVGVLSMLIAGLIGMLLGALSGYYENNTLKIGIIQLLIIFPGIFLAWFYAFTSQEQELKQAFQTGNISLVFQFTFSILVFTSIISAFMYVFGKIDKLINTSSKINFPVDLIISKIIEALSSIPSLLLIITIISIAKPSISLLILIIGLLGWTGIARMVRAEYLREKKLDYTQSAKAIGMSHSRIIFKHILPNIKNTLIIQLVFGIASAIIAEASLSFIGIGTPAEIASWGKLLNEARNDVSAWWLILSPGIMIFSVTYSCYKIVERLKAKT